MELARMDLEAMEEKLKGMLTEKRYRHSIGVMETAVEMAEIFGVDVEKRGLPVFCTIAPRILIKIKGFLFARSWAFCWTR